jgi:tripeptide aminopeptidase
MRLELLKRILAIPTYSGQESRMIAFLTDYAKEFGYKCNVDKRGNVYMTKGKADYYPCVAAHTDTVHPVCEMIVRQEGDCLRAFHAEAPDVQTGIGGDDKAGVFIALEVMEMIPACKAVFFVSEEIGCLGSGDCDLAFFDDVGYMIEFDSPCDTIMTFTCQGYHLFDVDGDFINRIKHFLSEHGVTQWQHHPYTDVWRMREMFEFSCLNLPAGYFRMHSNQEYVRVSVVENTVNLAFKILVKLGARFYPCMSVRKREVPAPAGFVIEQSRFHG